MQEREQVNKFNFLKISKPKTYFAAPCQDGHSFYFTQFGLDPVKAFLGSDPDAGFLKFAKN